MFQRAVFSVIFCLSAGLSGCQAPQPASGPTETVVEISDREAFTDRLLTLLREHELDPDIVDREQGLVISEPTTSGQWFESWRGDVRGGYQRLESSMHTIRRTVRIEWQPVADTRTPGDEFNLSVQVDKERFSSPERQVTTTSGALGIFSERLPTREGLRNAAQRGDHWVALGRDPELERYLLRRSSELAGLPGEVSPEAATQPASAKAGRAASSGGGNSMSPRPAGSPVPAPATGPRMGTMTPVR
jgi:hypothetical protein